VNGTLFFTANSTTTRRELWKSDGTAAGTALVKDINVDRTYSANPGPIIDVNGTKFFGADDGVHGWELWKSDGTAAGTTLVKDISPGGIYAYPYGYGPASSSLGNMTNLLGMLFFTASNSMNNTMPLPGLWKSDGTEAGTQRQ